MSTTTRSTVVGVFPGREQANRCIEELRRAGFRDDQIGLVARDMDRTGASPPALDRATGTHVAEGSAIGAATGAGVGALWAIGIATLGLPAVGPAVAGGILMAVLASAGGGAAVGTLVGALIGLGIPEEDAEFYESEFKAGRVLVTVKADGRTEEALAIIRRAGGYDRAGASDLRTTSGVNLHHTAVPTGEQPRPPVQAEEVHVAKTPVVKEEVTGVKQKAHDAEQVEGRVAPDHNTDTTRGA
jgi:hypothetical protein